MILGLMAEKGLGWAYERVAGPMRRAAVGQPCPRCGVIMGTGRGNPRAATVDHITPRHLGGGFGWENLRVVCLRCNSQLGVMVRTRSARRRGRRRPRVVGPVSTSRAW
jgi:5-methylcytosine-specific restriction endonuclease McrA